MASCRGGADRGSLAQSGDRKGRRTCQAQHVGPEGETGKSRVGRREGEPKCLREEEIYVKGGFPGARV
jgi:hypothetical protein